MSAAAPNPTQRLLELAAYLKRSFEAKREFDLDTVTGEVPSYEDDAPRRPDGTLERGTSQYESLRRKFRRDCEDLESMLGIVVAWDEHTKLYRVEPPFFTARERVALVAAATIAAVADDATRRVGDLGTAVDETGREVFLEVDAEVGVLRDAIAARQAVAFDYRGSSRELEPYALAYRDDHWYVAGRDRTVDATRAFRLDRVTPRSVGPLILPVGESGAFELPPGLDPASLFRFDPEDWGTDPPVTARVAVAADVAARFQLTVRGDIVERGDDTVIVEAEVRNRGAFRDRVLGFRDQVQVLDPPELVAVIDDWLRAIADSRSRVMAALTKGRRFEILQAAVAMAEERDGVRIADAAATLGVDETTLFEVLEPLLDLEFRLRDPVALAAGDVDPVDRVGDPVNLTYAFEVTARGVLQVREEHWLRDLSAVPPDPATALRLFLAATAMRASDEEVPVALGSATLKLRDVLAAAVVVSVSTPPALPVVRDAVATARTLRFRYVKLGNTAPTDREIEPHRLFSRWGAWYVIGTPIDTDEIRTFRIDGMLDARVTNRDFEPRAVEVPEAWDITHTLRTVDVTVPEADLQLLHGAFGVADSAPDPDGDATSGAVRVSVTVRGDEQLENLMLRVHPSAVFHDPDLAVARVGLARGLLAR